MDKSIKEIIRIMLPFHKGHIRLGFRHSFSKKYFQLENVDINTYLSLEIDISYTVFLQPGDCIIDSFMPEEGVSQEIWAGALILLLLPEWL
jgi:hypothetical protein